MESIVPAISTHWEQSTTCGKSTRNSQGQDRTGTEQPNTTPCRDELVMDIGMSSQSDGAEEPLDLRINKGTLNASVDRSNGLLNVIENCIPVMNPNNCSLDEASFITLDELSNTDGAEIGLENKRATQEVEDGEIANDDQRQMNEIAEEWDPLPADAVPTVWDTDEDAPWERPEARCPITKNEPYALSPAQLTNKVLSEGIQLKKLPDWKIKYRGYSLHVLHDGLLENWPGNDRKCSLTRRKSAISSWNDFLKSGHVILRGHTVVVVLEKLKNLEAVSQLKNAVASLVRAIRVVAREERRVFICNTLTLPKRDKVMGIKNGQHNAMLSDAVAGLKFSQNLSKVFLADVNKEWEAVVLRDPTKGERFFERDETLSKLGTLQYRACLFRELGLAPRLRCENLDS